MFHVWFIDQNVNWSQRKCSIFMLCIWDLRQDPNIPTWDPARDCLDPAYIPSDIVPRLRLQAVERHKHQKCPLAFDLLEAV